MRTELMKKKTKNNNNSNSNQQVKELKVTIFCILDNRKVLAREFIYHIHLSPSIPHVLEHTVRISNSIRTRIKS